MGKPSLDFNVRDTYDLRVLIIDDLSKWEHLESESTYVDITLPARTKTITRNFSKNSVNYFNSYNLGLTDGYQRKDLIALPDGIYKIRIYACEGTKFCFERTVLRTVKAELRLAELLIALGLHVSCIQASWWKKYDTAKMLLDTAHALNVKGMMNEAVCAYEKAIDIIDDLENCRDCGN